MSTSCTVSNVTAQTICYPYTTPGTYTVPFPPAQPVIFPSNIYTVPNQVWPGYNTSNVPSWVTFSTPDPIVEAAKEGLNLLVKVIMHLLDYPDIDVSAVRLLRQAQREIIDEYKFLKVEEAFDRVSLLPA